MAEHPIKLLRFADLKEAGVVTNWPQLRRLIDSQGFPTGYLLSPAVRVFDAADVERWLQTRRDAASQRAAVADVHAFTA